MQGGTLGDVPQMCSVADSWCHISGQHAVDPALSYPEQRFGTEIAIISNTSAMNKDVIREKDV
jgi:hypothetical protein